jgi:hypothetical protein
VVYPLPFFTEARPEVLTAHIERHDFGLLVSHGWLVRNPRTTCKRTCSGRPFEEVSIATMKGIDALAGQGGRGGPE